MIIIAGLSIIGIILVLITVKQCDEYIKLYFEYEDLLEKNNALKLKNTQLEIRNESLKNFRNLHAETEWVNVEGEVIYADLS